MGRISKEILEKIEKENIKPIGKWSFVLKESFIWVLFVLNVIFGSIGFAITSYLFESSDILNLILSVNDFLEVLILSIPIVWVLLTVIFILVGYINLRYTKGGYRYSIGKIFLINILCILVLGVFLRNIGVSEKLNNLFSENFPSYQQSVDPRYSVWSRPAEGYIAGEILSVQDSIVEIKDLDGNIWNIDISQAYVRGAVSLKVGEKIKSRGSVGDNNVFNALDVLPWEGRGRHLQQNYH